MVLQFICADNSLVRGPGVLAINQSYRVGRSSSCDFVLSDLSVTRIHAEITPVDEGIVVKDAGSRNGTFVDGVRIDEAEATAGQAVRFGNAQFYVVAENQEIPSDTSGVSTFIVPANPEMPRPW